MAGAGEQSVPRATAISLLHSSNFTLSVFRKVMKIKVVLAICLYGIVEDRTAVSTTWPSEPRPEAAVLTGRSSLAGPLPRHGLGRALPPR